MDINYSNKMEEKAIHYIVNLTWLPAAIKVMSPLIISSLFTFYYAIKGMLSNSEERVEIMAKKFKDENMESEKKVAIITGGNTGIGYETLRGLSKAGFKVILGCRDKTKGEEAISKINKEVGSECDIEFIELNLKSFDSVRKFATTFLDKDLPLHLLVNNAGVMMLPEFEQTDDGLETQFQVNHLSHFLLTNLLAHKLKNTPNSKVINLSSLGHFSAQNLDYNKINEKTSYDPLENYSKSKGANIMFTYSIERHLPGIQAFAVHPGFVKTELFRHVRAFDNYLLPIIGYFIKSPLQGAMTTLRLALSKDIDSYSLYFADELPMQPLNLTQDQDSQDKLWDLSVKLTGI